MGTQKTPYGKRVNKRIYDADRKMFFYSNNQEFSVMNRFEPLANEDIQEDVTSNKQEDFYNTNQESSNIDVINKLDNNNCTYVFNPVLDYSLYYNSINPGT